MESMLLCKRYAFFWYNINRKTLSENPVSSKRNIIILQFDAKLTILEWCTQRFRTIITHNNHSLQPFYNSTGQIYIWYSNYTRSNSWLKCFNPPKVRTHPRAIREQESIRTYSNLYSESVTDKFREMKYIYFYSRFDKTKEHAY